MGYKNRSKLLADAERLVNGDRDNQYGDPISDFRTTAEMWSAYLTRRLGVPVKLEPHDVAALMMCLKVSRISWVPEHVDNWADLAGYAACGWDCVERENGAGETYPKKKVVKRPNKGYYWGYEQEARSTKGQVVEGR